MAKKPYLSPMLLLLFDLVPKSYTVVSITISPKVTIEPVKQPPRNITAHCFLLYYFRLPLLLMHGRVSPMHHRCREGTCGSRSVPL